MIVLSFDLSSVCIGVIAANILDDKSVNMVKSCPIIPKPLSPTELGFRKSKKKLPTKTGEMLNTYYKDGETIISKSEKRKRDVLYRTSNNSHVLKYISLNINELVDKINPDLIIVEKNKIFNGILTSVLLGEIMGILVGAAGSKNIQVIPFDVNVVRKPLNVTKVVQDFCKGKTEKELNALPDVTKRALRELMEKKYGKYGLKCSTDDESDACVVFDYWYNHKFL